MSAAAWKNVEQEEYEASAPAVKAHFHALRAEEAWKRNAFDVVETEARRASAQFMEAANAVHDKRTVDALLVLAGNYEYRANEARARLPSPNNSTAGSAPGIDASKNESHVDVKGPAGSSDDLPAHGFIPMSSGLEDHDPKANADAETQLTQATAEIEELWQRLNELGLSSSSGSDKQWHPECAINVCGT
ncbi:hypothetical protein P43SY_001236 [Pythium insidiosum]|uniref:Uncharacterized protein n=1 Tax=Pythium insidiosum TaxID=114742 RepID=A0AAD5L9T0_PYTIN|nr:hypothetical protein P43SY_001236 [Pythium insidiosum]